MPRKRDRIIGLFSPSRTRISAPVQQSTSSGVATATPSAHAVPSTQALQLTQTAWEGVKTALVLLRESSWFPQLRAATGGLIALIDAIELTSSNAADLELLRQKVDRLTSIIKEDSRDRRFPWLLRRLSEFAEKVDEIVEDIDKKSDHGPVRRFAEGKKDKDDIATFVGVLSDLISNLQSELTLYTSRGINELLSNESLKKLKESEAACYDAFLSAKLVERRGCTPNTRQKILEDLMRWAKDPHSSRLYWMNGMAGTGKTTIAYSFCEQLQERGLLGANFFCSRSLAECSDIRYVIPTTARQLARSCPQFAPALLEALAADSQLPPLGNQLKRLLSEPFQHISEPVNDTLIIVIDALDECSNGASEIRLFLKHICNYFSAKTIPLKAFVTSRPEDVISRTITPLTPPSPSEWSVVRIHDIEESLVQADIKVYVEGELTEIAETWGLDDWPPSTEVDMIVGSANRLFIYAATVIRYVKEDSGDPCMRLSEMASQVGFQRSSLMTALVDGLYKTILERAVHRLNGVENQFIRTVLKLIVCAQTSLTLAGIADLLNASGEFGIEIPISRVRTALKLLHSVISTPMDGNGVATIFHASFPDFLFDSRRCTPINHIAFQQSHQDLARLCLHFMDKSLTFDDITGSGRWQTVDAISKQKKIETYIPSALAYACMFWASHIDKSDEIESLSVELEHFLTHQLLRWLEVLSLLRRLDAGVEVLQRMKEYKHPALSAEFDDACKFLKDIFDIINIWPCEVFHSGLVWVPEQSSIRKNYLKTLPIWNVCGHRSGWGACALTIRGHSSPVYSVAVSPDSRHVVSGSMDNTVRIWNMSTGEEVHVLRGHSRLVSSVTVSPDSRHVVSGSWDATVRIWNLFSGEELHVLRGHSNYVSSVAVFPDNLHIVSGSSDKTARIWIMSTGEELLVLHGHSHFVRSVAVSADNLHIVSGSSDETVRIWNASTGEEEHVLRGHSGPVSSVAVSPGYRDIVSGSSDRTVRIWDASSGEEKHVLRGHSLSVKAVTVSPSNQHVLSGSLDNTVRIWNMSSGEEERVLHGHSGSVESVAVSPDAHTIVSGSEDSTIRIWCTSTDEGENVLQGHSNYVSAVALYPDNLHVVSGSSDNTVRIWSAWTGKEERVLRGHSGMVNSVTVSPDNRHVVSGSSDKTVRIWDASTGEEKHALCGHSDQVHSVTVSPDNRHVVSGSGDKTIRIWDLSTGEEEHVLHGHSDMVNSVTVSPDNRHVVSGSWDKTIRIWNLATGEEEQVLHGHSSFVVSVAVSPDNRHIVSGSWDNTIRIWNAATGKEPPLVISFNIYDNYPIMYGYLFLSSMVTSIALLVHGDNTMSVPVIQQSVPGESLDIDVFLEAIWNRLSPVPIALTPDGSSILLSNGKRCLAIPSALRDIMCTAFSGSKVCLGHGSGKITILDISI